MPQDADTRREKYARDKDGPVRRYKRQAVAAAGESTSAAARDQEGGTVTMEQVVAIENALFAGERLAPAIVPIARQALDAWVREAAPELISSEAETGAS